MAHAEVSKLEQSLADALRMYGADLPEPVREFRAVPDRKFRWDFGWPDARLLVEVQGGVYAKGRSAHSGASLARDFEKLNLAARWGYRCLMFGPPDLRGRALTTTVETIRRALGSQEMEMPRVAPRTKVPRVPRVARVGRRAG